MASNANSQSTAHLKAYPLWLRPSSRGESNSIFIDVPWQRPPCQASISWHRNRSLPEQKPKLISSPQATSEWMALVKVPSELRLSFVSQLELLQCVREFGLKFLWALLILTQLSSLDVKDTNRGRRLAELARFGIALRASTLQRVSRIHRVSISPVLGPLVECVRHPVLSLQGS